MYRMYDCRGAMDGKERRMYRLLLQFSALPTSVWSAENCSCIFRTSHVHVGRLKIAPAFSALPPSVVVGFRKELG